MKNHLIRIALLVLVSSCATDSWEAIEYQAPRADEPVSFEKQVAPIFQVRCASAGCHDGTVVGVSSFLTYEEIQADVDLIRTNVLYGYMPPVDPMGADSIQIIADWIDQGALNN